MCSCKYCSLDPFEQQMVERLVETADKYAETWLDAMYRIQGLSEEEAVRCIGDGEDVVRELREEGLLADFNDAMEGKGAFTIPDNLLKGPNSEIYEYFIEEGIGKSAQCAQTEED